MTRTARFLVFAVIAAALVAGCVEQPPAPEQEVAAAQPRPEPEPAPVEAEPRRAALPVAVGEPTASAIVVNGTRHPVGTPARWTGAPAASAGGAPTVVDFFRDLAACTAGECPERETPACDGASCHRHAFHVDGTADALEVTARWRTETDAAFELRVVDASRRVVATGSFAYSWSLGIVARVLDPAPGEYEAQLIATGAPVAFEAAAVLVDVPDAEPVRDLLPDLVVLPPTDLRIEAPPPVQSAYVAVGSPTLSETVGEAVGAEGCTPSEVLQQGARKCLRFSAAVGNVGEGPLEVRLTPEAAGRSAVDGTFVQRVHLSNGSHRDVPAGHAELHAQHGHWHEAATMRYVVHAFDLATHTVGDALSQGRKAGICFADVGLVDVGMPGTQEPRWGGHGCFGPVDDGSWAMGLTPGWYDLYHWPIEDQFVDLAGLADGPYALCMEANLDGHLLESDASDNRACTPFRLDGSAITTLAPAPYHATPPDA